MSLPLYLAYATAAAITIADDTHYDTLTAIVH